MNDAAAPLAPVQTDVQDSLQGCLQFFIQHYRLNQTLTSLLVGLPLQKHRLTPEIFTKAARRAGLNSRVVRREIDDISAHVLPAVVMAKSGRGLVLLKRFKRKDDNVEVFVVLDTFSGDEQVLEREAFSQLFDGGVILVRPSLSVEMDSSRNPAQKWFWDTVSQFRPLYGKVMVSALIINLIALASPIFTMNVYDRVVPNAAYETLWVLAFGMVLAYVFDFIFKQLRVYFVDAAGKSADILLGSKIYGQLLNLRLGQQQMSAGAFANQLREYDSLRDFFTSSTLVAIVDLPFLFLFVFVIFLIAGPLALVPLVAIPVTIALCWATQTPMRELVREVSREMDAKHGHLVETINALENIKAMGSQSHAQGKWEQLTGVTAKVSSKTRFLSQLGLQFSGFIQNIVTVAMVLWGVYLISNGDMTMGALIASTMLVGRAMAPLSQVAALFVRYQQAQSSMETLTKLMNSPVERPEGKAFVHVKQLGGQIQFEDVSFTYPGSKLDSLKNVSFTINPGENVAIVGRSGSGKSTIARLLLGLYAPTGGSILFDGLEIRQMDPAEIRSGVCYFPQNLHLFRGTLRENLLLANPQATDDQMLQAVEVSGALRLIRRHPMGFDLPVGERGEMLSGGQRQAIGLARALMQHGPIAVLDDPTSEMDARSEEWVRQRLSKWGRARTLVLITHRPSMLDLVDRLIVMDEGRVVIDGPKAKVLETLRGAAMTQVAGGPNSGGTDA